MKYLLLIPACLSLLLCVFFYALATMYKWHSRWANVAWFVAAAIAQVGGLLIVGAVE